MTRYLTGDEERTVELVRQLDSDTTWLRHRGRAAELDRRLLQGATSSELSEVRLSWKGHITHLREVHHLEVTESPSGYWRISGAGDALSQSALIPTGDADVLSDDRDYEGGDDEQLVPTSQDELALPLRLKASAEALFALGKEGLLGNELIKASVGMLIRQASESRHWHNCAHYRSSKAAKEIQQANIKTANGYQQFCRKNMRHEHVVPNSVIYEMLRSQKQASVDDIVKLLEKFCIRATITREEDAELTRAGLSSRMPPSFYAQQEENPLARYIEVGLANQLQKRPHDKLWHEVGFPLSPGQFA